MRPKDVCDFLSVCKLYKTQEVHNCRNNSAYQFKSSVSVFESVL